MIHVVLSLEQTHGKTVGLTLHDYYRRVEVGAVVHILDNPVYKRAEEVSFAKLYDTFRRMGLGSCQTIEKFHD